MFECHFHYVFAPLWPINFLNNKLHIAHFNSQLKKKASQEKKRKSLTVIHSKDCFLFPGSELNKRKEDLAALDQGVRLARVDSIFSIFFPVMFLLFNVAYWPYWMM